MKYTHREAGTTDAFFFTSAPFEGFVFLCICRSDIWVPRSLSMYMTMDDDTHSSRLGAQGPFRSFPSLSLVTSSSSAHARARTNERTNERTRAGIFFLFDIVMSTLTGTRRELGLDRERGRAFARARDVDVRGRARPRRGRRGDARRRERHVWDVFFGGGRVRASVVVASSSRGRRADDDGPSTGRRRRVDRVNRRGCQSETICSYGLASGVWSLLRKRERERERRDDE